MHLQFPSISAGTILRHGLRPIEPFSSETAARGRGSVRRCGKNGRGVVRVGLLRRPGAGACPNLLQRRPGPGSAARRNAESQRFTFGAPARSVPLQQIWTTCAAAGPPGGSPRVPREGHHGSGGGRSRCPDRPGGPVRTSARGAPSRVARRVLGSRGGSWSSWTAAPVPPRNISGDPVRKAQCALLAGSGRHGFGASRRGGAGGEIVG